MTPVSPTILAWPKVPSSAFGPRVPALSGPVRIVVVGGGVVEVGGEPDGVLYALALYEREQVRYLQLTAQGGAGDGGLGICAGWSLVVFGPRLIRMSRKKTTSGAVRDLAVDAALLVASLADRQVPAGRLRYGLSDQTPSRKHCGGHRLQRLAESLSL